jgi:coenzyme F420-0:L-glutamate ligase / coenzyme F420-1:gamma-L-glutamate ligase
VAGLREAATLSDAGELQAAPDPAAVRRAVATVAADVTRFEVTGFEAARAGEPAVRCTVPAPSDPASLVRLGADVHRLRAALAAEGLASVVAFPAPGQVVLRVGRPA